MPYKSITSLAVGLIMALDERLPICRELGITGKKGASFLERTVNQYFLDGGQGFDEGTEQNLESARQAAVSGLPDYMVRMKRAEMFSNILYGVSYTSALTIFATVAYAIWKDTDLSLVKSLVNPLMIIGVANFLLAMRISRINSYLISEAHRRYGSGIIGAYSDGITQQ